MEIISEVIDINSKCRVCLSDDKEMHYLFENLDDSLTLKEVLTNTTTFPIEPDDGFSPYLCQNCANTIIDFYNLKVTFQENINQVKNLLKKQNSDQTELENNNSEQDEQCFTIKLESDEEIHNSNEGNTYTCTECEENYPDLNEIKSHLIKKHNLQYDLNSTIACEPHDTSLPTLEIYGNHKETHHKKHMCAICGASFTRSCHLGDHIETHNPTKNYKCGFCGKTFQRRTVFSKHKRIHTHPKQCICDQCGRGFNDRGTLTTHYKLIHLKVRNFQCSICKEKFPLKSTLDKHIARHKNKKREFFCTQCPLSYKDKSSLDRHIFLKHSGKNKGVSCFVCAKEYTTPSSLGKHLRLTHNYPKKKDEDVLQ